MGKQENKDKNKKQCCMENTTRMAVDHSSSI